MYGEKLISHFFCDFSQLKKRVTHSLVNLYERKEKMKYDVTIFFNKSEK